MKLVKKALLVVVSFALMMGLSGMVGQKAGASTSESVDTAFSPNVQLAYAKIKGINQVRERLTGSVEVNNFTYNKQVVIHYTTGNGQWKDLYATYSAPAQNGYETWDFELDINTNETVEFAVKYIANGQTFWDNNNGSNYKVGGYAPDYSLSKSVVKLSNAAYHTKYTGYFLSGSIFLKNLSPVKNVKVTYTVDNWNTVQTASAVYVGSLNNSNNSLESWTFDIPSNGAFIQFAISYEVNGTTYWDNNHSNNYKLSRGQYMEN
ncbi:carbohydrate-binding protein [Longirhabdus pacifica]|uniref:carbohydrate-binding protein n=1 Tax=Longirhabdus pacifica TaxID=2305227 RepID=UPI0010091FEE|nr:carbohydrate-binding protein [Longirhabdus pacifica]